MENIGDGLHDLVSFVEFKKREKHPRRSVAFNKVAGWSYWDGLFWEYSRETEIRSTGRVFLREAILTALFNCWIRDKKYFYHLSDNSTRNQEFVHEVLVDLFDKLSIKNEAIIIKSDNAPTQYKNK